MNTPTLKPCPFCGANAALEEVDGFAIGERAFRVWCTNRKCNAQPVTFRMKADQQAMDAWNTRPIEDRYRDALLEIIDSEEAQSVRCYGLGDIARDALKQ